MAKPGFWLHEAKNRVLQGKNESWQKKISRKESPPPHRLASVGNSPYRPLPLSVPASSNRSDLNPKQKLDDGWPESVEEQGLLLLVLRHYIILQDNILNIYFRQTRREVSRQYFTSTRQYKTIVCIVSFVKFFRHRTFYTQTLLHTEAFTHKHFYTQTLFTQTPLHTEAFTHRRLYTRTLFTHRRFYTQTLSHTETFTVTVCHCLLPICFSSIM